MIESKTPTGTNLIRRSVTLGAILLSGAVLAAEPAARKPKALLIMLDGCRAEKLVLQALPFCLGQDGTGNYVHRLDGEIDDFALWTRALTPCEIRHIYESGRKGRDLGSIMK